MFPGDGAFHDAMGSLERAGPARSAPRLPRRGRPVPRHLPRLSAAVHRERGVRPGQGARRHPGRGAPVSRRAQGAAHGLEPGRARGDLPLFDGIPSGRALLLRPLRTTRRPPTASLRACDLVHVRASRSPPRSGAARSTRPSSTRRRASAGASACSRTSPRLVARAGAVARVFDRPRGGPQAAAASGCAGARRRRDRLLRRPGGDGPALGRTRARAGSTWWTSTGPSRRAPADGARPAMIAAPCRCRSRSAAASATSRRVEAVLDAGARWAVVGTRGGARARVPRPVVPALRDRGHRRDRRLDGRVAVDGWTACSTSTRRRWPATRRRRRARRPSSTPTSRRDGTETRPEPRGAPAAVGRARRACPSSPPAASARSTTSRQLARRPDVGRA